MLTLKSINKISIQNQIKVTQNLKDQHDMLGGKPPISKEAGKLFRVVRFTHGAKSRAILKKNQYILEAAKT